MIRLVLPLLALCLALAGLSAQTPAGARQAQIFSGARIIQDGGGWRSSDVVVRDGRIEQVADRIVWAPGMERIDVAGKYLLTGFVSAHSHVTGATAPAIERTLGIFARYGITTVFSLGGDQAPAFTLRDAQQTPSLDRARIYVAGPVVTAATPDAARAAVRNVAALKANIVKIRVDDNLGTSTKMPPAVYEAVIDEAHRLNLRVAAHIFYLDDAKALLRAGVDMIAHSVRDREIDDEFVGLMKARGVPYCPTLTREVAAFVYESTPPFFSDPFFLREADSALVAQLQEPARQAKMRASKTAQGYKAALEVAKRNLKRAADAGLLIVMGTDSGAFPERFPGYFEHLEMEMMVDAGLTPAHVLRAATADAARTIGVTDLGAIAPGAWADFVVLDRDPLADIRNTRSIASVWLAGNRVGKQ